MDFELCPVSDAGRVFVDLCESHRDVFSSRAAVHDRDGSFPTENFADLARSGIMAATVPAELGGLGVSDLRDQVVGINRLARGDGSTAIAANMHIGHVRGLAAARPAEVRSRIMVCEMQKPDGKSWDFLFQKPLSVSNFKGKWYLKRSGD